MNENPHGRRGGQTRIWLAFSVLGVIVGLLIVPPFINVRRYQNRITQVVSASVGRPVRLSSVELRILPRPSFVLTDLIVEEDPAYGAEPVLHASTVTASIQLAPLWMRGRLEISRISVDEASLNVVRTPAGRWNLDPFFRTAAARTASAGGKAIPFPYLEATNSRINIKNGVEKLPYSLVNADLSFWQDSPGDWRVRLRGQPARTDVSLQLGDTGVLRLEASLRRAPQLRQMPIHLDVDWRQAQLGQLSRLVVGSDEGWRGDLTGELHVDGTPEAAQVRTRLRASGVHRAEFAPASPIDFDASCGFVYHYSDLAMENLLCDSPIGNGRARLTGEVPGRDVPPRLALELDRVPVQIALDVLRTVRNGLDPSLQAGGIMSGKMSYAPIETPAASTAGPVPTGKAASKPAFKPARARAMPPGPLSGNVALVSLRLSGDALSKPIQVAKMTFEAAPGQPSALSVTTAIAARGAIPLTLSAKFSLNGYQLGLRGGASLQRLRELAHVSGISASASLEDVEGQSAIVDLNAEGPWLASAGSALPASTKDASPNPNPVFAAGVSDHLTGLVTVHAVTWKAEFLVNPVEISTATLHLGDTVRWDPVAFSYGLVSGAATLQFPPACGIAEKCKPQFTVHFGSLDAAALQAAILGARQPGTLLSSLLARLRPASAPGWPEVEGTIHADTLILGPVALEDASATIHTQTDQTEIASFDAALMGGRIHAEGAVVPGAKPDYKLKGRFEQLNPADVGKLLGMTWTGDPIDGNGQVELEGFTDKDLATSAKGSLHFDWRHGGVAGAAGSEAPSALARFDRWTAEAEIGNEGITLKQNQIQRGARKVAVDGTAVFGYPPRVSFGASQEIRASRQ